MSRIGKKPVKVPSGPKVQLKDKLLAVSGSSATLKLNIHPQMNVVYDAGAAEISVSRSGDTRQQRALHGTTRALIANMIEGVTKGFHKSIEIYGTGYGVKVQGKNLIMNLGFAAPVSISIPEGISIDIKTPNTRGNDIPAAFSVSGPDKCMVGQFASDIRRARPPEPYLGKGVRFADEIIRHKAGKAFASGT